MTDRRRGRFQVNPIPLKQKRSIWADVEDAIIRARARPHPLVECVSLFRDQPGPCRDLYTLAASRINHIGYIDVTRTQRESARRRIFAEVYGVQLNEEVVGDVRD